MHQIAGTHLIIDAYVADVDVLTHQRILATFDRLVGVLKMEKLGEPMVREVQVQPELLSTEADEGGVSIIMPITTSHIAIHVWPMRKALMLDVFSCKEFDATAAQTLLVDCFHMVDYEVQVVRRRDPRIKKQQRSDNMFMLLENLRHLDASQL